MGIDAEMFVRYKGAKPTEHQLKLWSWDLGRAVGAKNFFIEPENGQAALSLCGSRYGDNPDEFGRVWHQDGDPIIAEDGEWFIQVSLWTRYYGVGYERGDWQTIVHTAEWLEANIGGQVMYGGDSSGVCATPFGKAERDALVRHALSKNGRDYYMFGMRSEPGPTPPPCGLCVPERSTTRHGWGKDYAAVSCAGCGRSFCTRDNGATWVEEKHQ